MPDQQEELTLTAAARLVRSSESTLRRLVHTGRLECRREKVGRKERILVPRTAVLIAFAQAVGGTGAGSRSNGASGMAAESSRIPPDPPEASKGAVALAEELSRQEHEIRGLHEDRATLQAWLEAERAQVKRLQEKLDAAEAEVRRLNAELLAMLRQDRPGTSEPRSLMRRILGL
jgi:hypothetical protein